MELISKYPIGNLGRYELWKVSDKRLTMRVYYHEYCAGHFDVPLKTFKKMYMDVTTCD